MQKVIMLPGLLVLLLRLSRANSHRYITHVLFFFHVLPHLYIAFRFARIPPTTPFFYHLSGRDAFKYKSTSIPRRGFDVKTIIISQFFFFYEQIIVTPYVLLQYSEMHTIARYVARA